MATSPPPSKSSKLAVAEAGRSVRGPARGVTVAARRAGGPAARDRPGDARRPGPEPDQHRPPGPDRRAAGGDGSGPGRATRSASSSRWSSRPWKRPSRSSSTCARWSSTISGSSRRSVVPPENAAVGRASRSNSTRSGRSNACRWTSRAASSGSSTRRCPPTSRRGRNASRSSWTGRNRSRRSWRPPVPPRTSEADLTPDAESDAADLPPALAAMMEDRRADARDALEAARREAIVVLPPSTWREIQGRAATLGIAAGPVGGRRRAPARGRPPARRRPGDRGDRGVRPGVTRRAGQGLVEYGLILALTALFTVLILVVFGGTSVGSPDRDRQRHRRRDRRLTASVRGVPPYHQPSGDMPRPSI